MAEHISTDFQMEISERICFGSKSVLQKIVSWWKALGMVKLPY